MSMGRWTIVGLLALGCANGTRTAAFEAPLAGVAPFALAEGARAIGKPRRAVEDGAALAAVEEDEHPYDARFAGREHEAALRAREARARFTPWEAGVAELDTPVLFGLLHAHTFLSDGSGTPEQAFARARSAGLDFLGITPHNHAAAEAGAKEGRRDGVLIANDPALYDGAGRVQATRRFRENGQERIEVVVSPSLQAAAAAAIGAGFVALFGQEFSTISSGNHANVFQPAAVIVDIANGEFRPLYQRLAADPALNVAVVQLNHPDVHRDLFYGGSDSGVRRQMFNDYGYDEYGEDFADLVVGAQPSVALVEVLSGPALDPHEHERFSYSGQQLHEDDYYFYLAQGFHVSPSVGQDNHFPTWGTATPARMGVLASARTAEAVIGAMRANRTYASEDPDLRLSLVCNGAEMGATLALAVDHSVLCSASVADATDPGTHYQVDLFYGDVAPARSRGALVEWRPEDGLLETHGIEGAGEVAFDEYLASGRPEFFYVRVRQGDGDRAWSAPIWINHPRAR
jgi:hypothetical protein